MIRTATLNRLKHIILISVFMLSIPFYSQRAFAITAITCHCFTDRSYNPARPFDADPYFLSTVQNTFFSIMFGVDKKSVVLKKQKGISGDDLWVAYWLGRKSGIDPEALLKEKGECASWREVARMHRIGSKLVGAGLLWGRCYLFIYCSHNFLQHHRI